MSTTAGSELLGFVREVKRFCVQLADLLAVVDERLGDHGWTQATLQNIAYFNTSATLDKPQEWFPTEAFRFYGRSQQPRIVAMVSILLDNRLDKEYVIGEPIVTAGWLRRAADVHSAYVSGDSLWYSRAHAYAPAGTEYGATAVLESRTRFAGEYARRPEWHPFDHVETFAAPLVAITSRQALTERIVDPLLRMVASL